MGARTRAVILGSAFSGPTFLHQLDQIEEVVDGVRVVVHRHRDTGGLVLFRHGLPHRYLPHQVPWRAHARVLRTLGVDALLLTSSVGVLDPTVPCFVPHVAGDLVMLDNRLPDGSACTMWPAPAVDQGHLVVQAGLFDPSLSQWIVDRFGLPKRRLSFAYVPGPRTKTAIENRILHAQGIEVNSMSVGPEVVLANELEIPTAAVLVGHKSSGSGNPGQAAVASSLEQSQDILSHIVQTFLGEAPQVQFGNFVYRFAQATANGTA